MFKLRPFFLACETLNCAFFFTLRAFSFFLVPSLFLLLFSPYFSSSFLYLLIPSLPRFSLFFPCSLLVVFNSLFKLALRRVRGAYLLRLLGPFHAKVLQRGGQKSLGALKWLCSSSLKRSKPQFGKFEGNPFPH